MIVIHLSAIFYNGKYTPFLDFCIGRSFQDIFTIWIVRAAVEAAVTALPHYKITTTKRALSIGHSGISPRLKELDAGNVPLSCLPIRDVCGQERVVYFPGPGLRKASLFKALYVGDHIPPVHNRERPIQLQRGLAGESDNAVDRDIPGITNQPCNRPYMSLILP